MKRCLALFAACLLFLGGCADSDSSSNNTPANFYFTADSPTHYPALWKSDGTKAGTQLVKTFYTPPTNLRQIGNKVLFVADYPHSIVGVWQSDGTADGTFVLAGPFSAISDLVTIGDNAYFLARNFTNQSELWKIDLVSNEALLIKAFANPDGSGRLQKDGSNLLLSMSYVDHNELWINDGTPDGSRLFAATESTADGIGWGPSGHSGKFFFFISSHSDPLAVEASLWLTDGTEAGTTLVKNVGGEGAWVGLVADLTDRLLLFVNDQGQAEYWGVDKGTAVAEKLPITLSELAGNYSSFANVGRQWFFVLDRADTGLKELWATDGSVAGTTMLKSYSDSDVYQLAGADDRLFFMVWPGWPITENAAQLWTSDGTVSGTTMVTDYTAEKFSESHYRPEKLLHFDGRSYYFTIFDYLFWKTDTTEAGTEFIKNLAVP